MQTEYWAIHSAMELVRVTIDSKKFRELDDSEQLFLVRLGQIHNDMRRVRQMVVCAHNGVKTYTGIEHEIALHSLIFAVRLWCAVVNEAEDVIQTGWHGSQLSKKMHVDLNDAAKDALKAFQRYFAKRNLVRTVRDKFASHYDRDCITSALKRVSGDYTFVTSERSGNIFYNFSEAVRHASMLDEVGSLDPNTATNPLYRELGELHDWFMTFSHAIMVAITGKCGIAVETFNSEAVVNQGERLPTIFVDERAMVRTLKQRRIIDVDEPEPASN
jgi:hypothetical protein